MGAYHICNVTEYLGKTVGVVLFIYIFQVVLLLSLALGIAHIVNIEAQGLGKVVETV
jgi:hypothetical protein